MSPNFQKESIYWRKGVNLVCGIDEAGRGAWAGPVVSAGVIFAPQTKIIGLNDSKKLAPKKREQLYDLIIKTALFWSVGSASSKEIDDFGLTKALCLAIERLLVKFAFFPRVILLDGYQLPLKLPENAILNNVIHGDCKSKSIAAASIIAKVTRDNILTKYDNTFPNYSFSIHKGYGTKNHINSLKKHGPSAIHRLSYRGVINA